MKKLMFAAVIAASAAAFAAPLTAVDFEGANDYQPNGSGSHFFFDGDSNSSVVTNTSPSTEKRTANYAEANNANYLALDTEGGTLWRSINDIATSPDYGLGTAQDVAATGTYLDTLVQFTVTEDEAPMVGEDDKLAIWLQAGEGTTNLMVRAAIIDDNWNLTPTNFVISNASVEPGTWYRLTVKTIADVTEADGVLAFQIYLDGNPIPLKSSLLSFTAGYLDLIDSSYKSAIQEGSVFVSLQGVNSDSLQGVGFQGTGAVDEIVWTEENPLPAATTEFTLTYSGDSNVATLGAVTYTVDGGEPQTPTENKIPDGATVSIAAPTFASGYQLGTFTVGGTAVASPTFPYSFTITSNTTVEITSAIMTFTLTVPNVEHATATVTVGGQAASGNTFNYGTVVDVVWAADSGYQITANGTQQFTMTSNQSVVAPTVEAVASYPDYLTSADATIKGKYDTWKDTYGADVNSEFETAFLLNMDPETTVASGTALLKIASITEVSGGWELEIASDATTLTAETNNDGLVGNGYLAITYAADLATLTSGGTTVNLPVTVTNGKIKVTVTASGAKFMKAKLTTAAETVAGE